jgi:predicted MFS family arabinose efflux permease
MSSQSLVQRLTHPTAIAVVALGITQIIAWGGTVYALGVLAKPIAADTGWSNTLVFAGITVALLASGVVSTPVGIAMDRYGARGVMAIGFVANAVCLAALAFVETPAAYLAVWAALGIAMRLTLYDAAFAALVQIDPENGRRAISYLTLFGGLASTIGWPVGHALNEAFDWRVTFLVFAASNLLINLPLAWFGLIKKPVAQAVEETSEAPPVAATKIEQARDAVHLTGRDKTLAMALFALALTGPACAFGIGAVHLVAIIEQAGGIPLAAAVGLASLKGIAQVVGRIWDLMMGKRLPAMLLSRISIGLVPVSFALLLAATGSYAGALAFTLVFGVANGLVTIARGALPLALFGAQGYGAVLGLLATPFLLFNALAPLVFAFAVDWAGYEIATWALLAVVLLSALAMEVLHIWHRRLTATAVAA